MKKIFSSAALLLPCMLAGCSAVGDKAMNMSAVYVVTTLLSILMLIGYLTLIRKKELWLMVLFTSTVIVNIGYLWLANSSTLGSALMANRLSYLGSVLLPLSMLLTIIKVCRLKCFKCLPFVLICTSILVFMIATSYPCLDIYYKDVGIQFINGVTVLDKVYGPWHVLYLVFLLAHFTAMVAAILHAAIKKTVPSHIQAVFLAAAVFANLGVWLLEQLVKIDFEFLSVSYIISEIFLIGLFLIIQDGEKLFATPSPEEVAAESKVTKEMLEQQKAFIQGLETLTPTEKAIYDLYTEGKGTKDVLAAMCIKENTLKFHNKNLYSKLGVSSRKQLLEIAKWL
ncbi:MAG: hypothetical protein IJN48_00245 [Clostridia bacterium]|nr:hypothetical protein [Clostridia bacterium]